MTRKKPNDHRVENDEDDAIARRQWLDPEVRRRIYDKINLRVTWRERLRNWWNYRSLWRRPK